MSNPNDLLDPLRFKSLGEYKLQDIRDVGGGVFTMVDTLEHLEMLDKIAKAYQSVHAPTYGQLIPSSPFVETGTVNSASTVSVQVLNEGEVIRYQAISVSSTESGTTVTLMIYNPTYGKFSNVVSVELTTSSIQTNILTEPLEIAYPQQLGLIFSSSGSVDASYSITSCKTQQ